MKKQSVLDLDIIGASSAMLCLLHCVLFPVISMLPLYFLNNKWIDMFFVLISIVVVSKIVSSRAARRIKMILSSSLLFLLIGVLLEAIFEIDTPLVLIGGIGMFIGHLLNYKSHSK
ncbi:MerC domain-containing protein [Flavobacterium algicola]|uniref:MerC domain-containing protein n=1 Tax=Flavobacterium algicola TaxID=556529 RepID=UPI001EFDFBA3|nr:MerC domain-containing protein [Flavobacterium algicola]MCG9792355.1 MerC domain-containing protein [Flavobacterium algicola]